MTDHLVDADSAPSGDDATADDQSANSARSDTAPDPDAAEHTAAGAATATTWWSRWRERRRTRVSKWDRPPPPKDWRYFVGTLGKVLIATGVLMFGFVAYQLWGTGIETARAQNQLRGEFDEQVEAAAEVEEPAIGIDNWVVPVRPDEPTGAPEADTGPAAPVDDPTVDDPATNDPASGSDAVSDTDAPEPGEVVGDTLVGEASAVVPGAVDLSDYAVDQNVRVVPDEAFARIEIPRIGTSHHVVPGVTVNDLKKGPGHYPDTPLPGQLGNASIAGHRTTYGSPFFNVDQLTPGDEIIVTMITGDRFVYRVTGSQVVTAADSWVISTRDPSVAELTLTTCDPKYTARNRLVVHSVLVPEKSAQVGVAEFYDFDEPEPAPIPGDDPTFAAADDATGDEATPDAPVADAAADDADLADEPVADEPVADDTTGADEPVADASDDESALDTADDPAAADEPTAETDTSAAAPEPAGTDDTTTDAEAEPVTTVPEIDPDEAEIDAFSQGWFDDRDAFPQIALWGSLLTLISLLAYQVSKKTRHDSIGFLVGILPFLLALYFFFQNINRLLPPGL